MSLKPQTVPPVPQETERIARRAFPKGNVYMTIRDELGVVLTDELFAPLFSSRGKPAEAPWRLILVTLLQLIEDLSDQQAADGVRSRIDWKYLLSLDVDDAGFDPAVLCEFRTRIAKAGLEEQLLDTLLEHLRKRNLVKSGGRQRTDATHVLSAARTLSRFELVTETMRVTLDALAEAAPDWLRTVACVEWVDRYTTGWKAAFANKKAGRDERALTVGADGFRLLGTLTQAPEKVRELPEAKLLWLVWLQNYQIQGDQIAWRDSDNVPPASLFVRTPHDPEARIGVKREEYWLGYKTHLTETCDPDLPPIITDVRTTPAPTPDGEVIAPIHKDLKRKDLLPKQHYVDAGYTDSQNLVASEQDYEVELVGPPRPGPGWQTKAASGYDSSHFKIDWDKQVVTCPNGRTSRSWSSAVTAHKDPVIKVRFSASDCQVCEQSGRCFRSNSPSGARRLTFRPQTQHEALVQARRRGVTPEYRAQYAVRSGIEGTISRYANACGARRARYPGQARVHMSNVFMALAMNLLRVGEWYLNKATHCRCRSSFNKLMLASPCSA